MRLINYMYVLHSMVAVYMIIIKQTFELSAQLDCLQLGPRLVLIISEALIAIRVFASCCAAMYCSLPVALVLAACVVQSSWVIKSRIVKRVIKHSRTIFTKQDSLSQSQTFLWGYSK